MKGVKTNMLQTLFRRNSLFVTTIFGGAFVLELTGNGLLDKVFDANNKGKLWVDLEKQLQEAE